jgi:hypothetical protein
MNESELSEIEKLLGFRVRNGMVLVSGEWSVPRIQDMRKAVEVIQGLIDKQKEKENVQTYI